MFTFQTIGRINGMTPSRDGRMIYLKLIADPVTGVDIQQDEEPDTLDLACSKDLLPAGASIDTRIHVEGSGAIAARQWRNPSQPNARLKIIHNTRLQARSIKLAK